MAKKIYNEDILHGGRQYNGEVQVMKQIERANLAIDGERTIELDYDTLHLSIIASLEGWKFAEGFDPYEIPLPDGIKAKDFRSLCKVIILVAINSNSAIQCIKAVEKKLEENHDRFGDITEGSVDLWEVMKNLKVHNPYTAGWINSGKGTELQNIDSLIADKVVETMLEKGIVTICIHDSFITQERYKDVLGIAMVDAYESVLGSVDNCGVSEK